MATEVDVSAQLTFVEIAKRTNNKKMLMIAEVLDKATPIIKDAYWLEANLLTGHKITRRESLPSGTWRGANEGVSPEASQTQQIVEPIGYLEGRSEVDEMIIKIFPDQKKARFDEDLAFLEGLGQTIETAFFYGNRGSEPNSFDGLRTRYNLTSMANVHGSGGTGSDTSSIYLVQWGQQACHLVYPRNSKTMGVEHNVKGRELITTTAPARFYAWVSQFIFNLGLVVRDDRCVQIVTNIETAAAAAANIFDEDLLIDAISLIPRNAVGTVIYMNKTIKNQIMKAAKDKPNVHHTTQDPFGRPIDWLWGLPIHVAEMIVNTEAAVS